MGKITARSAATLVLLAAAGAVAVPAASAAARPGGVQRASSITGDLSAVAATSARNAWAVGTNNHRQALIMHWNGTRSSAATVAPICGR